MITHPAHVDTNVAPGQIVECSIPETEAASAMHLMANLYTDVPWAVLRELVANGIDSHVRAGHPIHGDVAVTDGDHPRVIVDLPTENNPTLTVTDFGTGMSRDIITEVYGNFSVSTKRGDDTQIGQLGAGAKAPYAMVNQFTAVSRHNGTEYHVLLTKTAAGKPAWTIMAENPTDEPNGVSVSMTVPPEAVEPIQAAAFYKLGYFGIDNIDVTIDGEEPDQRVIDHRDHNLVREISYGSVSAHNEMYHSGHDTRTLSRHERPARLSYRIVMGGIAYTLPGTIVGHIEEYFDLPPANPYTDNVYLANIWADIGTLTPAPNRESIVDTPANREAVVQMLKPWVTWLKTTHLDPVHRALRDGTKLDAYRALNNIPSVVTNFHTAEVRALRETGWRAGAFVNTVSWQGTSPRNTGPAHLLSHCDQTLRMMESGDDTARHHHIDISNPDVPDKVTVWRRHNGHPDVTGIDMEHLAARDPQLAREMRQLPLNWLDPADILDYKPPRKAKAAKKTHRRWMYGINLHRSHDEISDEDMRSLIAGLPAGGVAIVGTITELKDHDIQGNDADIVLVSTRKKIRAYLDELGGKHLIVHAPRDHSRHVVDMLNAEAESGGRADDLSTPKLLSHLQNITGIHRRHLLNGIGEMRGNRAVKHMRRVLDDGALDPHISDVIAQFLTRHDAILNHLNDELRRRPRDIYHAVHADAMFSQPRPTILDDLPTLCELTAHYPQASTRLLIAAAEADAAGG